MPKAIVIIGLPGSGKTTLAEALGGRLVDDASQNEEQLVKALKSDEELVVITDANAVFSRREKIVERINRMADREVQFICFENDPETCWVNLCRRGDNKISRVGLIRMAQAYDLDAFSPDIVRPVFKA